MAHHQLAGEHGYGLNRQRERFAGLCHKEQHRRRRAMSKVIVPGEVFMQTPDEGQLRLGPGVVSQGAHIMATRVGLLKQTKSGGQVWLEGRQKRYIPAEGEVVVGTVLDRHGETFSVDIGGPFLAQLPQLSFEGATRRNRPAIKPGDLVYARVVSASRDVEPVLSCMDALGRAAGFGHLKDGFMFKVNTSLARQLLGSPPPPVLQALGASLVFELAVGMNGRVWVNAPHDAQEPGASKRACILVANAVQNAEFLTEQQAITLVHRMLNA